MLQQIITPRQFLNLCFFDELDTISVLSLSALFSDHYESEVFFFDVDAYESYHSFLDDIVSSDLFGKPLRYVRYYHSQLFLYVDWI